MISDQKVNPILAEFQRKKKISILNIILLKIKKAFSSVLNLLKDSIKSTFFNKTDSLGFKNHWYNPKWLLMFPFELIARILCGPINILLKSIGVKKELHNKQIFKYRKIEFPLKIVKIKEDISKDMYLKTYGVKHRKIDGELILVKELELKLKDKDLPIKFFYKRTFDTRGHFKKSLLKSIDNPNSDNVTNSNNGLTLQLRQELQKWKGKQLDRHLETSDIKKFV